MSEQTKQNEAMNQSVLLELASADAPDNIEARLELISAYRSAGMSDAAKAELARLSRMCPQHPLTMAEGLRALLQQQAMPPLNAALVRAINPSTL